MVEQLSLFPELPADLAAAGVHLHPDDPRFLRWCAEGAGAPVVFGLPDLAQNIAAARTFLASQAEARAERLAFEARRAQRHSAGR